MLGAVGTPEIVTVGPVWSTIQVTVDIVLILPAESFARIRTVWLPSTRPVRVTGDVQDINTSVPTEQSTVASASVENPMLACVD